MKFATAAGWIAAAILVLSSVAAGAADEPEAVYRKLHSATLAGNVDEMLKYASTAQRAEITSLPDRATALKFLATMMPNSYAITSKVIAPDGKTARILATGAHIVLGQTQPMYGEISLRKEAGDWKVDQWDWSNDRPDSAAVPAPSRTAPAASSRAAPSRTAGAPKPPGAAPREPTLRRVEPKGECVFKPVMTGEDIDRCRASGR